MIEIKNLSYKDILDDITLTINEKDYLAIIGENGSGKSTLIKCIIGINKVKHNTITIDDKCISCYKKFSQIGYVPQITKTMYELPITVYELLYFTTCNKEKIIKMLTEFNVLNLKDKNINKLSGGQRQKINIVKALLRDIDFLILDEPETGLDKSARKDLKVLLNKLNKQGLTIIVVSHYLGEKVNDLSAIYNLDNKEYKRMRNV